MTRSKFTEAQILAILREQEAGMPVAEVCRKHGVSSPTFYKWKVRFAEPGVSEAARRPKALEDENARLKRLLADAMLDNVALKDQLGKKEAGAGRQGATPPLQRSAAQRGKPRSAARSGPTAPDGTVSPPSAHPMRAAILERLADYVLAEGLSASSLRPLAEAAEISDRMLLYYFKDKAEVIAATLERVSLRLAALLNEQVTRKPLPLDKLRSELVALVFADELWPFMRLWLEIAALAARNDPFYREVGGRMARGFLAWGAAQLDSATPKQREADAARLLVMMEGMLLLKSVGLDDVCQKAR